MSLEVNSVGKYFVSNVQPSATASTALASLAVGETGIYLANGTAATTSSTAGSPFFIANKLPNGEVVSTDIIDPANIRYADNQAVVAGVAPVYKIANICTSCNKDYAIKFDITDASAFQAFGFQAYTKLYSDFTGCCDTDAGDSCIEVVRNVRNAINADIDNLVVAIAANPASDAELDDEELNEWEVATDGCPVLILTVQAQAVADFCGIPYNYTFPTGVSMVVSTIGFDCCTPSVVTTTETEIVYPQGAGPDVKYQEWYHSKNSLADSQYHITGDGVVLSGPLNALSTGTYSQVVIAYDAPIRSGFLNYQDPKTVTLAVSAAAAQPTGPVAILRVLTGLPIV